MVFRKTPFFISLAIFFANKMSQVFLAWHSTWYKSFTQILCSNLITRWTFSIKPCFHAWFMSFLSLRFGHQVFLYFPFLFSPLKMAACGGFCVALYDTLHLYLKLLLYILIVDRGIAFRRLNNSRSDTLFKHQEHIYILKQLRPKLVLG